MKRPLLNTLRSCRRARRPRLSQRELAQRVGITQGDVSRYERGRRVPSLPLALDLANALGRPLQDIFAGLNELSLSRIGARLRARRASGRKPSRDRP